MEPISSSSMGPALSDSPLELSSTKGVGESYNRFSAKGGGNQKIPFQPGLSLGSIVRGDIIDKMESYGKTVAKMENIETQLHNLEQGVTTLEGKIKAIDGKRGKRTPVDEEIRRIYQNQIDSLKSQIEKIPQQLKSIELLQLPFF